MVASSYLDWPGQLLDLRGALELFVAHLGRQTSAQTWDYKVNGSPLKP